MISNLISFVHYYLSSWVDLKFLILSDSSLWSCLLGQNFILALLWFGGFFRQCITMWPGLASNINPPALVSEGWESTSVLVGMREGKKEEKRKFKQLTIVTWGQNIWCPTRHLHEVDIEAEKTMSHLPRSQLTYNRANQKHFKYSSHWGKTQGCHTQESLRH